MADSRTSRRPHWRIMALELLTLVIAWLLFIVLPNARAAVIVALSIPIMVPALIRLYWLQRRHTVTPRVRSNLHIAMTIPALIACCLSGAGATLGAASIGLLALVLVGLAIGYSVTLIFVALSRGAPSAPG
jgi:hypothetical protein